MDRIARYLPSHAMLVAYVALFVALGGTGYAADQLATHAPAVAAKKKKAKVSKQIDGSTIKKGSIPGDRLKGNSVTGAQINASTLGTVPTATNATKAGHASSADTATHANNADSATNANHATTADTATTANALPALSYQALALVNNWTGAPFSTRQPAVAVDAQGIVHFRGAMGETGSFTPLAFTLPASLRPSATVYIHVDMCNASSGRIVIEPSGETTVQAESHPNAECFTSLEGASYPLG
jgi:hypothetical protein